MRKVIRNVIIILLAIYSVYIFTSQQKMLNTYATEKKQYQTQIDEAKAKQQELNEIIDNINSNEYIEEIAREKLDMYLPNERVYIDIEK